MVMPLIVVPTGRHDDFDSQFLQHAHKAVTESRTHGEIRAFPLQLLTQCVQLRLNVGALFRQQFFDGVFLAHHLAEFPQPAFDPGDAMWGQRFDQRHAKMLLKTGTQIRTERLAIHHRGASFGDAR